MLGLSEGEPIGGVCRQESHDLTLVHRHGQASQVTHDVDQLLNCRLLSLYRLESCAKKQKRNERMDVLDNVLSTQGVSVSILDQFSFLLTDL